jgi:hypothetical protein
LKVRKLVGENITQVVADRDEAEKKKGRLSGPKLLEVLPAPPPSYDGAVIAKH